MGALVAAYKGSPYFDYYADKFEPFYRREWRFLVDYNRELLEVLCRQTGLPVPPVSDRYVEASAGDLDLRPKQRKDPAFVAEPYVQVFADRLPFAPDLSFIDLLLRRRAERCFGVVALSMRRMRLSRKSPAAARTTTVPPAT